MQSGRESDWEPKKKRQNVIGIFGMAIPIKVAISLSITIAVSVVVTVNIVSKPTGKINIPEIGIPQGRFSPPLTLAQYKAQMISIPAGEFTMGSDRGENNNDPAQKPAHKVTLSGYKIGLTPVTVGMWEEFCQEQKPVRAMPPEPSYDGSPSFNKGWSKKDHPIVNVSWKDAQDYCAWSGLKLPTEAQWEKAARGTDGRNYPWGNDFDGSKLWRSTTNYGDVGGTHVVGGFPNGASPFGCLDMAGNVWQWCQDAYDVGFYASPNATQRDPVNESGDKRIFRGGSWGYGGVDAFRCVTRDKLSAEHKDEFIGFRCVSP